MKKPRAMVFVLFFVVLALRLIFAYGTPFFDVGDSYFHMRQAEHILDTGFLLLDDPLSFGGRSHVVLPVFEYFLAAILLVAPLFIKFVLNACAASTVLIVFLLGKKLVKNEWYALYGAFVAGFIPLFFAQMSTITPLSIFVPLLFALIYAFLCLPERRWIITYLALLVLLTFLDTLLLVFVISLGVYFLIVYFERMRQSKSEIEVALFSIFFVVWAFFLIYKEPLLLHGVSTIWGASPTSVLALYFSDITIGKVVYGMGFIPFLFGLWVISVYFFQQRSKVVYVLTALIITLGGLLWLRLLDVSSGLILLGVAFSVLFCRGCELFDEFVRTTKFSRYKLVIHVILFSMIVLTSVVSSIASASVQQRQIVSDHEYEAMQYLGIHAPVNSTVLAGIDEGYVINALAGLSTMIDGRYVLVPDSAKRYDDHRRLFTTSLEIDSVELLDQYGIQYIYLSNRTKKSFSINNLRYVTNEECFSTVFENEAVSIIKKNQICRVRVIETN